MSDVIQFLLFGIVGGGCLIILGLGILLWLVSKFETETGRQIKQLMESYIPERRDDEGQ